MAVTKRTRFEVLRRDNYTCRYCRSADGVLTIDHVMPVSLGGTDDPSNLVACCKDCNAGKSSSSPDDQTVAQVAEDALRLSRAIAAVVAARADNPGSLAILREFRSGWVKLDGSDDGLTTGWEETVLRFHALGLTVPALLDNATVAIVKRSVPQWEKFRYFCGVSWSQIRAIQAEAAAMLVDSTV